MTETKLNNVTKSHIYPKSILKKWLIRMLKISPKKKLYIYRINLDKENFSCHNISSEKLIENFMENHNFFYLNYDKESINPYEQEWNINIEQKFMKKIYYPIVRNLEQYWDKPKQLKKRIENLFHLKTKEDLIVLYDWVNLIMFRSLWMGNIHKQINLKDISIDYNRNPELLMNIGLQIDPYFLKEQFKEFKKNNNFDNYNVYFYFNQFHTETFNPPLFHNGDLMYIMPIFGVGEIIIIKKNWFIKIFDDTFKYVEYKDISEKERSTLFDFFVVSQEYTKKLDKNKIKKDFIHGSFIPNYWIENIGVTAGEIYTLCNDIEDNCIEIIMKDCKNKNIFEKRKNNLNDPKKYNRHVTSFIF